LNAVALPNVSAVREDGGRFAALSGKRVLIYWPHGFGDWVTLGGVLPLLETSNAYAITRFGDDYVSLMEGNATIEPLYSGERAPGDGSLRATPHFGLQYKRCDGRSTALYAPAPLDAAMARFAPDALLWSDYPETEGRSTFPFHTKARNLIRALVAPARLAGFDLAAPLRSAIDFTAPASVQKRVDECLARFAPPPARIAVISRRGFTAERKNWETAAQARAFAAAMRQRSRAWHLISMEDEALGEGVAGFRELFADLDEPFARIFKALATRTDLLIGVPAGPLHFSLARGGIPTVGLWAAHHPDWYDEPNPDAIHVVGRYVRDRGFERRPATTTKPPSLRHRLRYLETPGITAEAVVESVDEVLR
jgi:hypothetical protein